MTAQLGVLCHSFKRQGFQITSNLNAQFNIGISAGEKLDILTVAGPQRLCRKIHVTQRCGKSNSVHSPTCDKLDSMNNGLKLHASLGTDEGMQLIDYHGTQCTEKTLCLGPPPHQSRL